MGIDNFDSGISIEDILRDELSILLPKRYSVDTGIVVDRNGKTAGECDLLIFNKEWFPAIKLAPTSKSRRSYFPIEGLYAVCEVKQTLDFKSLDKALEKLVICHRLNRPATDANRLVENWELDGCFHGLKNPLYSAVVATSIKDGIDLDQLVQRFYEINQTLRRQEVIRSLCVLNKGTITWGFEDLDHEFKPALFMRDDLFHPIIPIYHKVPAAPSAFYSFVSDLMLHLYQSVLAAEDVPIAYGPKEHKTMRPQSSEIALPPDSEWLEKLNWKKDESGNMIQNNWDYSADKDG